MGNEVAAAGPTADEVQVAVQATRIAVVLHRDLLP